MVRQIMAGDQTAVAEFYERSIGQLRCFFRARNAGAAEAEIWRMTHFSKP